MIVKITLVSLMFIFTGSLSAQVLTDSNLPIIIINTYEGIEISDIERTAGSMKIIYRGEGQRTYFSDQNIPAYVNYNGSIDIEIRGSSSQDNYKKQYGFTTRMADDITTNNVSLLGMPPENDWILNGMNWDPSLIRDYLCFNLSRQIGEYASRTAYCELIINGDYRGLYLLAEKIKADDNRVNITKIGVSDIYLPELSGGYIIKADKTTPDDPDAMKSVSLYDTYGRMVEDADINCQEYNLDMRQYAKGLYILQIVTTGKNLTAKIKSHLLAGKPGVHAKAA